MKENRNFREIRMAKEGFHSILPFFILNGSVIYNG